MFVFISLRASNCKTQNGDFPLQLSIFMNEGGGHKLFFFSPLPLQFRSRPPGGGMTWKKERVFGRWGGGAAVGLLPRHTFIQDSKTPETSWPAGVEQPQQQRRRSHRRRDTVELQAAGAAAAAVTAAVTRLLSAHSLFVLLFFRRWFNLPPHRRLFSSFFFRRSDGDQRRLTASLTRSVGGEEPQTSQLNRGAS